MNKDRPLLLTSYSFDHGTALIELANAIIMYEYPLSIVDHVRFKGYSNVLQPLFKVPCRNTMKAELFKIYECQRGKTMILVVSNASRLAITTDMWTSSSYVSCPHTKEVLCDQLLYYLMDWNINRKISNITVDNCSTNDVMIDLLWDKLDSTSLMLDGNLFHMRYCAHILNLIIKDGLDVIKIRLELRDWLNSENEVIRKMAKRMVEKFDKYWSVVHGVVGVSAMLDPRYKINVLEFYIKLLFPTTYKEEVEKVHTLCYKLRESTSGYATIYDDVESGDSCVTREPQREGRSETEENWITNTTYRRPRNPNVDPPAKISTHKANLEKANRSRSQASAKTQQSIATIQRWNPKLARGSKPRDPAASSTEDHLRSHLST
ncbi:hypothetical protein RHSIM_Rhsim08G0137800 [Rhododendron simsii]|uniref:hAT-like transposase RNase-H fold domain-containing protein n=1 Tax=Rhododendron simsii TaxID=118357 RepID=A0A834GGE9_RHOSS|nr:hypothetical protein RHSIM_Rhsim08G0137800 [Rhododendron simsii]